MSDIVYFHSPDDIFQTDYPMRSIPRVGDTVISPKDKTGDLAVSSVVWVFGERGYHVEVHLVAAETGDK